MTLTKPATGLLTLLVLLSVACGERTATPASLPTPLTPPGTTTPPTLAIPPQLSLNVTAKTDKASYSPGEKVEVGFSFTNTTQEPLTLSDFPPYTEVVRAGFLIRAFERGNQEVTLGPGETATSKLTWDQLDTKGRPVNPAVYTLSAKYLTVTRSSPQAKTQESYQELGPVDIEFPQGAIEKTIEANESRTVEGITIKLQRVELSAEEIRIQVLKTPGYTPAPGVLLPPSRRTDVFDIRGTYRIDDGVTMGTGSYGWRSLENGIEFIWESLYPAPRDAKTLFFTITRLTITDVGDFGPWEFKVPLQ